ncbi:MAG: FG-GAP-like repeat-containing protein [Pseudomonadota bacterium]
MNAVRFLVVFLCLMTSVSAQEQKSSSDNLFSVDTHILHAGDLNGDGIDDTFAQPRERSGRVVLNFGWAEDDDPIEPQSFRSSKHDFKWSGADATLIVTDINGDGFADIVGFPNDKKKIHTFLTKTKRPNKNPNRVFAIESHQSFKLKDLANGSSLNDYLPHVGDFNGNGRTDLLMQPVSQTQEAIFLFAKKNGRYKSEAVSKADLGVQLADDKAVLHIGDFNGDGRDDLFVQKRAAEKKHKFVFLADSLANSDVMSLKDDILDHTWNATVSSIELVDFTNDGLTDFILTTDTVYNEESDQSQFSLHGVTLAGVKHNGKPRLRECSLGNLTYGPEDTEPPFPPCFVPVDDEGDAPDNAPNSKSSTSKRSDAESSSGASQKSTSGYVAVHSANPCQINAGQTTCSVTLRIYGFGGNYSTCLFYDAPGGSPNNWQSLGCGSHTWYKTVNFIDQNVWTFKATAYHSGCCAPVFNTVTVSGELNIPQPSLPYTPFFQGVEYTHISPNVDSQGVYQMCFVGTASNTDYYHWEERVPGGAWSATNVVPANYNGHCVGMSKGQHATAYQEFQYRVRATNQAGTTAWVEGPVIGIAPQQAPSIGQVWQSGIEYTPGGGIYEDWNGSWTHYWFEPSYLVEGYKYSKKLNSNDYSPWNTTTSTSITATAPQDAFSHTVRHRVGACITFANCVPDNPSYSYTILVKESQPPSTPSSGYYTHESQPTAPFADNDDYFQVRWNASVGTVEKYQLQRLLNGSNAGWWWVTGTAYAQTGLQTNDSVTYTYRVRSKNGAGYSSWRNISAITVLPEVPNTPTGLSVAWNNPSVRDFLVVDWTAPTNTLSDYYRVTQTDPNNVTTTTNVTSVPMLVDLTQGPYGNYQYSVEACHNDVGCSTPTGTVSFNAVRLPPGTPSVPTSSISNSLGDYVISWNLGGTNHTHFVLEESLYSGTPSQVSLSPGNAVSKSFNDRSSGSYKYRVKACNEGGCSSTTAWSDPIFVDAQPGVPTGLSVAPTFVSNAAVSWAQGSGASPDQYQLQMKIGSGSWNVIHSHSSTSASVGSASGDIHYFRVRACNNGECSGYSSQVSSDGILKPNSVVNLSTESTFVTNINVNWAANPSGDQPTEYHFQEADPNWAQIWVGPATSATRSPNGDVRFRVKACNAAGCSGWQYTPTSSGLRVPGVVTGVAMTSSPPILGDFTLNWTAPADGASATTYELFDSTDDVNWSSVGTIGSTSFALQDVPPGNRYYRIVACGTSGCGAPSSSIMVDIDSLPLELSQAQVSVDGATYSITLSWVHDDSYTDHYEITWEYANGTGFGSIPMANVPASGTSHTFVPNGTTQPYGDYSFDIRACSSHGCSDWQENLVLSEPMPPAPTLSISGSAPSYQLLWSSFNPAEFSNAYFRLREFGLDSTVEEMVSGANSFNVTHAPAADSQRFSYFLQTCNASRCMALDSPVMLDIAGTSTPSVPEGQWSGSPAYMDETGSNFTLLWNKHNATEGKSILYRLREQPISTDEPSITYLLTEPKASFDKAYGGLVEYRVSTCEIELTTGVESCGTYSPPIVRDLIAPAYSQINVPPPALPIGQGASVAPGQWEHLDKSGHGWMFYWRDRLREDGLFDSPFDVNVYDLVGYWFTYAESNDIWTPIWWLVEFKTFVPDGNSTGFCHAKGADKPGLWYEGTLKAMNQSGDYGDIGGTVCLNVPTIGGDLSLYVSSNIIGFVGEIDEDFLRQVVPANSPQNGSDHYTGLYSIENTNILVFEAIVGNADSIILTYFDQSGRRTWIRGDHDQSSLPGRLPLAQPMSFISVEEGYSPFDTQFTGALAVDENFSATGNRSFDPISANFRTNGTFWLDSNDPNVVADIGTSLNPLKTTKRENLNAIAFSGQDESLPVVCATENEQCQVFVDWFAEGDYPNAAVFIRNKIDQTASQILGFSPTLSSDARYAFELHRDNSSASADTLIAVSGDIIVEGSDGPDLAPDAHDQDIPELDADSSKIGYTTGSLTVDRYGQLRYEVPIMTGPASGGLTPKISLTYSSGSNNGPVGMGWDISGVSIISRCSQTFETDGAAALTGVQMTADDRFCLDGQRLIAINGADGESFTEYRTEINTFAKIMSYGGTVQDGPEKFVVWRKDGTVSTYGGTADSRILTQVGGSKTFAWAINKLADSAENFMTFEYCSSVGGSTNGCESFPSGVVEYHIKRINYADNDSVSPQIDFTNKIEFDWATNRSDKRTGYVAGVPLSLSYRLNRIDSFSKVSASGGYESLRSYVLGYEPGGDGHGRSMLSSISECSDSTSNICFKPTEFEWIRSVRSLSNADSSLAGVVGSIAEVQSGDINGDGLADLVYVKNKVGNSFPLWYRISNGSGFDTEVSAGTLPQTVERINDGETFWDWRVADINGDRYDDILFEDGSTWLMREGGEVSPLSTTATLSHFPTEPAEIQVIDLNADGRVDLLYRNAIGESTTVYWQRNFGYGSYYSAASTLQFDFSNNSHLDGDFFPPQGAAEFDYEISAIPRGTVDFNGDGAVDVLLRVRAEVCQEPDGGGLGNNCTEQFPGDTSRIYEAWHIGLAEDGTFLVLPDPVGFSPGCDLIDVCPDAVSQSRVIPADLNGDLLADMLIGDEFSINVGGALLGSQTISGFSGNDNARLLDYDGDGLLDILVPQGNMWALIPNTGSGFAASPQLTAGVAQIGGGDDRSLFVDFTGDGKLDQVLIDYSSGNSVSQIRIRESKNGLNQSSGPRDPENVIVHIDQGLGLGQEYIVSYAPLTDPLVYTRGTDGSDKDWGRGSAVYDVSGPQFVVSRLDKRSPSVSINRSADTIAGFTSQADTFATTLYHYIDGKLQIGRGFLGFSVIEMLNDHDVDEDGYKLATRTRFRLEHPWTGLVSQTNTERVQVPWVPASFNGPFPDDNPPVAKSAPEKTGIELFEIDATIFNNILEFSIHDWKSDVQNYSGLEVVFPYRELSRTWVRPDRWKNPSSSKTVESSIRREFETQTALLYGTPTSIIINKREQVLSYEPIRIWSERWDLGYQYDTTANLSGGAPGGVWRPGLLSTKNVKYELWDGQWSSPIIIDYEYQYDSGSGLLRETNRQQSISAEALAVTYTRDEFGNRVSTMIAGDSLDQNRVTHADYDQNGRFVVSTRNALNQIESQIGGRDRFGNPTSISNISGLMTTMVYDHMGRPYFQKDDTGAWRKTIWSDTQLQLCPSSYAVAASVTNGGGIPETTRCYDRLGRAVTTASAGFSGSEYYFKQYRYDVLGRLVSVSEPCDSTESCSVHWNHAAFDDQGRLTLWQSADNLIGVIDYAHLEVTSTVGSQVRVDSFNALGNRFAVEDNEGGVTTYSYRADGRLSEIDGPLEGVDDRIQIAYDSIGNRTQLVDPDRGTTYFSYNALGELDCQLDANQNLSIIKYDSVGRVNERIDRTGQGVDVHSCNGGNLVERTRWVYGHNSNSNDYGLVVSETMSNEWFSKNYHYDSLGRLSQIDTELRLETSGGSSESFMEGFRYDQFGRLFKYLDASGSEHGTQFQYNDYGYLSSIHEAATGASSPPYKQITAVNARGSIAEFSLRDSTDGTWAFDPRTGRVTTIASSKGAAPVQEWTYNWTELGNLSARTNQMTSQSESYGYDGLNRLTSLVYREGTSVSGEESLAYDEGGNLRCRRFDATCSMASATHEYAHPVKVHAVTSIDGLVGDYGYDNAGNVVSRPNAIGGPSELSYTTFNKLHKIRRNQLLQTSFRYGTDRSRYHRYDAPTDTHTYYVGSVEIIDRPGSNRIYRRYISENVVVDFDPASNFSARRYLHRDHLGSIDVITNDLGDVVQDLAYDIWGQRRAAEDWTVVLEELIAQTIGRNLTTSGFTGHEHIDDAGIIHMGGRVFDSVAGRFLQADPFVQDAVNPQFLNRYTYTLNNPLRYVDPSGYTIACGNGEQNACGDTTADFDFGPGLGAYFLYDETFEALLYGQRIQDDGLYVPGLGSLINQRNNRVVGEQTTGISVHSAAPTDSGPLFGPQYPVSPDLPAYIADATLVTEQSLVVWVPRADRPIEAASSEDLLLLGVLFVPYGDSISRLVVGDFKGAAASAAIETGLYVATGGAGYIIKITARGSGKLLKGPGEFIIVNNRGYKDRAMRYQSKITGRLPDVEYLVDNVKFDGFDDVNGILLEAKGPNYASKVNADGTFKVWFTKGANEMVDQAQRQLRVANGTPIQWHFAEAEAAEAVRELFLIRGVSGIEILVTPP